jgi:hypothetical protein
LDPRLNGVSFAFPHPFPGRDSLRTRFPRIARDTREFFAYVIGLLAVEESMMGEMGRVAPECRIGGRAYRLAVALMDNNG